jgi:hypothetical protein
MVEQAAAIDATTATHIRRKAGTREIDIGLTPHEQSENTEPAAFIRLAAGYLPAAARTQLRAGTA